MKKWDPIEVVWLDATSIDSTVNAAEYMKNFKPCVRRQLGAYLGEVQGYIFISSSDDTKAEMGGTDCDYVMAIPLKMVLSKTVLQPVPKRRKA